MKAALVALAVVSVPVAAGALVFGGIEGAAGTILAALLIVAFFALVASTPTHPPGLANRPVIRARQFLGTIVLTGLALRIGLAILLAQTGWGEQVGGDAATFHNNGRLFEYWLEGRSIYAFQGRFLQHADVGYFVVVGTIYFLFGPIQLLPTLLNCLIGALTAIPAHRLVARIGGAAAGRTAAILVAFFPSLVLWSCLMVRDAPVFFLILWSAVIVQDLLRRFDLFQVVLLAVCLAALASLRSYIFMLTGVGFLLAFGVGAVKRPLHGFVLAAVGALIALVVVRGLGLGEAILDQATFERLDEQRRLNALAGSAGIDLGGHDLTTVGGALTYLPIGLMYFLLAPFPWEMAGEQLLAIPDVIGWYVCLPFAVFGIGFALRRRRTLALPPLLAALMVSLFYALVEGNSGIIVRHRAQVLVLLLPFAAIGIARWRARSSQASVEVSLARSRGPLVAGSV